MTEQVEALTMELPEPLRIYKITLTDGTTELVPAHVVDLPEQPPWSPAHFQGPPVLDSRLKCYARLGGDAPVLTYTASAMEVRSVRMLTKADLERATEAIKALVDSVTAVGLFEPLDFPSAALPGGALLPAAAVDPAVFCVHCGRQPKLGHDADCLLVQPAGPFEPNTDVPHRPAPDKSWVEMETHTRAEPR